MGMKYDNSGRRIGTTRHIRDESRIPLLVGAGWEDVAYTSLLRLELEAATIHRQLEGEAGCDELGEAVDALKAARLALKQGHEENDDGEPELGLSTE